MTSKKIMQVYVTIKLICFYSLLIILLATPCLIAYKFFILDRYFLLKNSELTISQLGTFGDFFGGTINPILTYFTIIGIVITVFLQKKQLNESKSQYIFQQVESNLYNLISIHNAITNSLVLDFNELKDVAEGANFQPLRKIYKNTITGRAVFDAVYKLITDIIDETNCELQTKRYKKLQDNHNHILGHYFRNLYQILKIIDDSPLSKQTKKIYSNILRAQLSSSELAILMINCLDGIVDDGGFKNLLIEYEFLEHIPLSLNSNNNIVVSGQIFPIVSLDTLSQYIPDISKNFGAFGRNKFFATESKNLTKN